MAATILQFRTVESEEACTCVNCGVEFASPILKFRRNDGGNFYCPNGHQMSYTETEATKLRKQLTQANQKREEAERQKEWAEVRQREAEEAKRKVERKLKRTVKRVNAGVCPHCQRTFQQLARHMQCKHAEILAN
jgi:hypothetical protein